jgi:hypothetical protein
MTCAVDGYHTVSSSKGDSFARRHEVVLECPDTRRGARGGNMVSRTLGRLNAPRPALVETAFDGAPRTVNRQLVALVREEWRVVDRWWTDEPVDRRYFEVVLESGQNVCVYRDREQQCWFSQNA